MKGDTTSYLLPLWVREPFMPISDVTYWPVYALSTAIGQDADQIVYLFCILMSFVACLILGQIDSVPMRKTWSTLTGFLIGSYFYGLNFSFNIAYIFVNYLFMLCLERHLAAKLMTIWSGTCLFLASINHFYLSGNEDGNWDIDLIFMMNFIKFHMMAVNYSNAGLLDDPVKGKDLTTRERYFAEPLRQQISLVEFFNYYLFCGSSWTGMSHEYRWYEEFINRKGDYANIPKDKLLAPFLERSFQWLLCLLTMVGLGQFFNY